MSKIPDNIIERILSAANIVDVIGEDISLRKAGVNYKGLCPFHDDKTPSFVVSPVKGICKCFSCGEGGNVIWYLQKKNNWTFPEAVTYLGNKYGIDVPKEELTPEEQQRNSERESVKAVMAAALDVYVQNLASSSVAIEYLQKRGINADTMKKYGICCSYDISRIVQVLVDKGFKEKYIKMADLAREADDHKVYDTFRNRILLPFMNRRGEVIGFTGRDITGNSPAKYLNNNDTVLFNKGSNIWGLYQANKAIRQNDKVYVVEGQFDVLSLSQRGVCNVVAGSGTAFTDSQTKMLRDATRNVTFIYDGDAAGLHAAEKNIPGLVKAGFNVRCIRLPEGLDPDDLARKVDSKIGEWLAKNEHSYVYFLADVKLQPKMDAYSRLEETKKIIDIIALEDEKVIRDAMLRELSKMSGYQYDELSEIIGKMKIPERKDRFDAGFHGLEFIESYIDKDEPTVKLTNDFDRWQKLVGEEEPVLFYAGSPSEEDVQQLCQHADRFIVLSPSSKPDGKAECADMIMMKMLFYRGAQVDVIFELQSRSFIYFYVAEYGSFVKETANAEIKNHFIQLCAQVICKTSEADRTINLPAWAEALGLKVPQLKEILKPLLKDKQSKARVQQEGEEVWADLLGGSLEQLPDYVNESDEYRRTLRRYKFYPQLNKSGVPVCYIFRDDNGSLHRVADFFLEPLFHVYNSEKDKNLRVCRLNSLTERPTYIAWPSSNFVKLSSIQEMLVNEGGYNFENGTAMDWNRIWADMSHKFPKCNEISVYGQQKEECFVFANAIYHEVDGEWKLELADELGLMQHGDLCLYSPSFSKVNAKMREDNDRYEQDKWLVYTDTPRNKRISFEKWASLMNEVYKVNDNGKWALIFAILCAFRSDIYPINRLFTSIFFLGPTMPGKTQIAVSIRSLFIKPDAPCFNLNSGTDAAFFSVLERYRDVPQVMEEYNDDMISDTKFQGLKSVTYDGDGKQKRKAATGNDIETSKVNAPVILLGQEAPQKDDNALSNRVVLRNVPKAEHFDEHAQHVFQVLKDAEKAGLSYLLLDILKLRPKVKRYYHEILKQVIKEIQIQVERSSQPSGDQTRVITTVSMFVAMVKFLVTYAPELRLPFSYEQFFEMAVEQVRWQVGMLVGTDKIATFFNTFSSLLDAGVIKAGRDFDVRRFNSVLVSDKVIPLRENTAVIYFNLTNIHDKYQRHLGTANKPLSLQTLTTNLTSNSSWIGQVKNWRFNWMESEDKPMQDIMEQLNGKPNMVMTKVMVKKTKVTSAVVLNYDILQALYSVDFERDEKQ